MQNNPALPALSCSALHPSLLPLHSLYYSLFPHPFPSPQSKEDVLFIRRILDEAGGERVKIISKIENAEGLVNYDEILRASDGIMVREGEEEEEEVGDE